jgi:hypothetical protein
MVLFGFMSWKEIVLIIIGYLIVRFIMGVRKARKTVLNMKDQMEQEMQNAHRAANRRPEGEISIDKNIDKDKDSDEFADFEEID